MAVQALERSCLCHEASLAHAHDSDAFAIQGALHCNDDRLSGELCSSPQHPSPLLHASECTNSTMDMLNTNLVNALVCALIQQLPCMSGVAVGARRVPGLQLLASAGEWQTPYSGSGSKTKVWTYRT
jgi:hypothetical protein